MSVFSQKEPRAGHCYSTREGELQLRIDKERASENLVNLNKFGSPGPNELQPTEQKVLAEVIITEPLLENVENF